MENICILLLECERYLDILLNKFTSNHESTKNRPNATGKLKGNNGRIKIYLIQKIRNELKHETIR